jgi:hypothetical protein
MIFANLDSIVKDFKNFYFPLANDLSIGNDFWSLKWFSLENRNYFVSKIDDVLKIILFVINHFSGRTNRNAWLSFQNEIEMIFILTNHFSNLLYQNSLLCERD